MFIERDTQSTNILQLKTENSELMENVHKLESEKLKQEEEIHKLRELLQSKQEEIEKEQLAKELKETKVQVSTPPIPSDRILGTKNATGTPSAGHQGKAA